jgi:hypothetical protein
VLVGREVAEGVMVDIVEFGVAVFSTGSNGVGDDGGFPPYVTVGPGSV